MNRANSIIAALGLLSSVPSSANVGTGYVPQDKDERGIWMQMDEAERKLKTSNFIMRDPALNSYVRSVFCRTVGEAECKDVRFYIVRTPEFNASMAPNGMMVIFSGLFLRTRDEAQLAGILGHEYTHYQRQHSLKMFREVKSKSNTMAWLSIIPVASYAALGALTVVQLGMLASVYGFSRDMEREADGGSLSMLSKAGYDPMSASRVWMEIRAEDEATALERKSKAHKGEGSIFATHPPTLERMIGLKTQAEALAGAGTAPVNRSEFRAALAPFWAGFIDDQIKLNDFGATEFLIGHLASDGWTPELQFARGELYRSRGKPEDFPKAAEFYHASVSSETAPVEAWRGLGLALLRAGKQPEGQAALKTYLAKSPTAPDRAMMAMLAGGEK